MLGSSSVSVAQFELEVDVGRTIEPKFTLFTSLLFVIELVKVAVPVAQLLLC